MIDAAGYATLDEALAAASDGDVVVLAGDVSVDSPLMVSKSVSIDGKGATLSTASDGSFVIGIDGDGVSVELSNMKVKGMTRGVQIGDASRAVLSGASLKLDNVEVEATDRAIAVMSDAAVGLNLEIAGSTVSHGGYTDYDTQYDSRDTRALSLWNVTDSTVKVSGSTMQGYAYPVNVAGPDGSGLVVTVENSTVKGRCAINAHTPGATYNVSKCDFTSINNQGGTSEGFAAIVVDSTASDNTVNVKDTAFKGSFNGPGVNNPNATAYMTSMRAPGGKARLSGKVTYSCLPGKGGIEEMGLSMNPDFKVSKSVYGKLSADWIDGKMAATLGSDGMYSLSQ